jgi:microcystin degradation protein MlrC
MRIGVGCFVQETNSFSPFTTRLEDFDWVFGDEIIERSKGADSEIRGFCDVLTQAHHEVASLFAGRARVTSGPIEASEFERGKSLVLEQVRKAWKLDGLLLALHGAMCAEGTDDCEGALLRALRELVGREFPIIVTLDLHANVTEQIVANADAVIGYKTYPHTDLYETGQAAAQMLIRTLQNEIRPVTVMQKIPLIVPAENMHTTNGPMGEVFFTGEAIRATHPQILCVSVFGVQPWLDINEMGGATVVVVDRDPSIGRRCAVQMAKKFWELKDDFEVALVEPQEAVRAALALGGKPVVLAESSDSPSAGSPGDSADLLRAILAVAPGASAALWVRDKPAVVRARELGPGARLQTQVGGSLDKRFRQPCALDGVIRSLSDGHFVFKGAFRGMEAHMGRTAVVDVGKISVILSENGAFMVDPEVFRSQGIEPRDREIVVVKSAAQFRSDYGTFAAGIIMVDTPGVSSANLRTLPYQRVSRPIYPLDRIEFRPEGRDPGGQQRHTSRGCG